MASTTTTFSFKDALAKLPRGEPLSVRALEPYGLSPYHAAWLARHGWLEHLGRDAYLVPGTPLTREGCLAFFSTRISGLHVGSRTALAWRGVRHSLEVKERISLWGERPSRLPSWFTERFDVHYQATQLFAPSMSRQVGLQPLPNGRPEVLVSVPERALLELLSDVGKTQTLEEVRHLVEGLHNLRTSMLDGLLGHTTRIKVVRLALMLAEQSEQPWAPIARAHSERLGGGRRWVAVAKSGQRLDLRRK